MELTLICFRLFDTRWVHPDMVPDACAFVPRAYATMSTPRTRSIVRSQCPSSNTSSRSSTKFL